MEKANKGIILKKTIIFFYILFILLLYIYPRAYPYLKGDNIIKPTNEFIFRDPDSCYHAKRIIYIAQHNMKLPFFDPLLAHPVGAVAIWSPAYDWISALPSYILSLGSPSKNFIIWVAIWLNLIFGLLQIFILALLLYKAFNLKAAAIAAFLITIIEPHIGNTSIERLDHNSFALFIFTLALYEQYKLFLKEISDNHKKNIFALSFLISLLFWTWPGSYIYLIVLILANLLYIVISRKQWLFTTLSIIFFLSSILVFPLAFINYHISKASIRFEFISFFTCLFLLATAIFFYFINLLWQIIKSFQYSLLIKSSLLILILLFIIYYSYTPLIEGLEYAKAQNRWLSTVIESKSFFYLSVGTIKLFTLDLIISGYGYLIFIFPIIFLLILFRKIKITQEIYSIIIISAIFFSILAAYQRRFAFELSIPFALVISVFLNFLYDKLIIKKWRFLALLITLIFISAFIPVKQNIFKRENSSAFYAFYPAFKWLKEEGSKSRSRNSQIGIMAPWDLGHHIQFYSELPTVADNFGFIYMTINPWQGFYDMARFFLTESEEEAIEIMKKYKCEYVVVPEPSIFEPYTILLNLDPTLFFDYKVEIKDGKKYLMIGPKEKFFNTIGFRLSAAYGSANPSLSGEGMQVQALKHFQLIYELPATKLISGVFPVGSLKIYKYTEGIRVSVPGKEDYFYKLEAPIITNAGNKFYYRQYGKVKEGIIMPYPSVQFELSIR